MTERVAAMGGQRSARVELVGGSPLLHIEGGPVAWFENWIPVDRAPDLTDREAALIGARLRRPVRS